MSDSIGRQSLMSGCRLLPMTKHFKWATKVTTC